MTEQTNAVEQSAQQAQPVQAASQPEADLSRRTLVMLVALACIISLVGTVAMIYELSTARAAPTIVQDDNHPSAGAEVGFVIGPPQQKQASSGAATGFATLRIGE